MGLPPGRPSNRQGLRSAGRTWGSSALWYVKWAPQPPVQGVKPHSNLKQVMLMMGSESAAATHRLEGQWPRERSRVGAPGPLRDRPCPISGWAPEMSSLVCKSLSSCALMKGHLSEYPVYLHKQDSMLESSDRQGKQPGHNTMWKTSGYKSTLQSGSFWRGNTHSLHSKQEISGEQREVACTGQRRETTNVSPSVIHILGGLMNSCSCAVA